MERKKSVRVIVITLLISLVLVFFMGCFQGERGESVFDVAVRNGFTGTEQQFLGLLQGENAFELAVEKGFDGTLEEWLAALSNGTSSVEDFFNFYQAHNPAATIDEFIRAFISLPADHDPVMDAVQIMLRSTVSIRATKRFRNSPNRIRNGAGVILSIDRQTGISYIITNYHVIYDHSSIPRVSNEIRIAPFGREFFSSNPEGFDLSISASLVGGSFQRDIAILRTAPNAVLTNTVYRPADTASSSNLIIGEQVVAVGNPAGDGIAATRGIVSLDSEFINMTRIDATSGTTIHRVFRTDAAINPGNSGGGVFNRRGELIGIAIAKTVAEEIDNMAYVIPSNIALAVADIILRGQRVGGSFVRFTIGLNTIISNSTAVLDNNGFIRVEEQIEVSSITTGSPSSGVFEAGDVITRMQISGREAKDVTRSFTIADEMLFARSNSVVSFDIIRAGMPMSVKVNIDPARTSVI